MTVTLAPSYQQRACAALDEAKSDLRQVRSELREASAVAARRAMGDEVDVPDVAALKAHESELETLIPGLVNEVVNAERAEWSKRVTDARAMLAAHNDERAERVPAFEAEMKRRDEFDRDLASFESQGRILDRTLERNEQALREWPERERELRAELGGAQ